MGTITGIGHVALKVHDLDKSLAFYRDKLGFPEMMRLDKPEGGVWLVYLRITDEQFIEIFPGAENERSPGWNGNAITHVCLTVDDLDTVVDRVTAAGIRSWSRRRPPSMATARPGSKTPTATALNSCRSTRTRCRCRPSRGSRRRASDRCSASGTGRKLGDDCQ
jgi:catechol 2,3-dioxygenase-like lactoylglutathione lyase family enzyme